MIESLVKHFSELADPRCAYKVEHRLLEYCSDRGLRGDRLCEFGILPVG